MCLKEIQPEKQQKRMESAETIEKSNFQLRQKENKKKILSKFLSFCSKILLLAELSLFHILESEYGVYHQR